LAQWAEGDLLREQIVFTSIRPPDERPDKVLGAVDIIDMF
jgi:hypothetical protein